MSFPINSYKRMYEQYRIKQWHVPTKEDLVSRHKRKEDRLIFNIRLCKIKEVNKKLSDLCLICEKEVKLEDKLICEYCFEKYND